MRREEEKGGMRTLNLEMGLLLLLLSSYKNQDKIITILSLYSAPFGRSFALLHFVRFFLLCDHICPSLL